MICSISMYAGYMCGIMFLTHSKLRTCMHYGDVETAEKMLATRTGLQAKYLSNSIREKVQLRAEWSQQRYAVMYALVAFKFRDATLRKLLLDMQQSELKEWVKSWEGYWSALSYSGEPAQNMLGHILMEVRKVYPLA